MPNFSHERMNQFMIEVLRTDICSTPVSRLKILFKKEIVASRAFVFNIVFEKPPCLSWWEIKVFH